MCGKWAYSVLPDRLSSQLCFCSAEDFPDIRMCLPAVTFAPIPEAGHYLHVQKPAEFVNYVVKFLND